MPTQKSEDKSNDKPEPKKLSLQEKIGAEKKKLHDLKEELDGLKTAILKQQSVVDGLIVELPKEEPHETLQNYFRSVRETEEKKAREMEALRKAAADKLSV